MKGKPMKSTVKEIREECDNIAALMAERDFVRPECTAMIKSGATNFSVHLAWNEFGHDYKTFFAPTLAVAFAETREWIRDQPPAEDRKRQEARETTAKAIELLASIGAPTDADTAALAQMQAAMKRLSGNILTDQRGEG